MNESKKKYSSGWTSYRLWLFLTSTSRISRSRSLSDFLNTGYLYRNDTEHGDM